jgi:hypothetical protein
MVLESFLPPVSFQSVVNGQWWLITTKEWIKVDRKYSWDEMKAMWQPLKPKEPKPQITKSLNISKRIYKVEGSKGNVYSVKYDSGRWSCTCPAFGWSRGKECKHIKGIKTK